MHRAERIKVSRHHVQFPDGDGVIGARAPKKSARMQPNEP